MWTGMLYLKNEGSNVQMFFLAGNRQFVNNAMLSQGRMDVLRIGQRMRFEASQLEGVAKRMQVCKHATNIFVVSLYSITC